MTIVALLAGHRFLPGLQAVSCRGRRNGSGRTLNIGALTFPALEAITRAVENHTTGSAVAIYWDWARHR